MRKILLVCAALACMTVSPVPAQDAAVKKIIEMGQNDNQVMHQLDILTNRFGGRLIGSDAYENAAEWMVREFKSWGLDVQLEEAGTVPVGFNRGPWFGRLLSDNGMILHFDAGDDKEPVLVKEPLVFEAVHLAQRNYKD